MTYYVCTFLSCTVVSHLDIVVRKEEKREEEKTIMEGKNNNHGSEKKKKKIRIDIFIVKHSIVPVNICCLG